MLYTGVWNDIEYFKSTFEIRLNLKKKINNILFHSSHNIFFTNFFFLPKLQNYA